MPTQIAAYAMNAVTHSHLVLIAAKPICVTCIGIPTYKEDELNN